jgi:acetyl/propionyl-CoA carboxylase alpha subunit
MKHAFRSGGEMLTLDVEPDGEALRVRLPDGSEHVIRARRLPGEIVEIVDGERIYRVPLARGERGAIWLAWGGAALTFMPAAEGGTAGRAVKATRSGVLTAPMVGVVADVSVTVGDRVAAYQPVAVVEAMKVLATLEAPFAGIVAAVHAKKGDAVEHGAPLVEITPDGAEGET